jgi:hypothetical protein
LRHFDSCSIYSCVSDPLALHEFLSAGHEVRQQPTKRNIEMTTHAAAARGQKDFALDSTLTVHGSCWQKAGTAGEQFYALVLSKAPKTVGECIELAAALEQPLKAQAVQAHLKWAYTSASGCLEIDGQRYGNGSAEKPAEAVVEPKAKKPAKAKKAKAEPTEQSAAA